MNIDADKVSEIVTQKVSDELFNFYQETWKNQIYTKVSLQIDKLITETAAQTIKDRVKQITEDTFFAPYQPVDVFGKPTGVPTTIAQSLDEATRNYWTQKVDAKGVPQKEAPYGQKLVTRAEHFIAQAFGQSIDSLIDRELIVSMAGRVKDTVRTEMRGKIDSLLGELFKVQSLDDQAEKRKV
jgi:hypothetical protein